MKKLIYVLYALVILAVIGLLGYDIFVKKQIDAGTVSKAALILLGTVSSLIKLFVKPQRKILRKKKVYQEAYGKFIGNAFANDPKLEKQLYLAIDDYNQDKPEKAIEKLNKLRKQCHNSEDLYCVECFTGFCYGELGLKNKALEQYNAAMNLRPNSTLASNIGGCYLSMGNFDAAAEAYLNAMRLDPTNPFPCNNMAQLYIKQGEYEEAIPYAQRALDINRSMPQALSAMAICHAMLGNREEYETYYRRAVSSGYDGNQLKRYISALDPEL